jgi:ATP-dependent RNA helicase DDX27
MPLTEERQKRAEAKAKRKAQKQQQDEEEEEDDDEDEDARVAEEERINEEEYYDNIIQADGVDEDGNASGSGDVMFSQLNLSRRLLRAVQASGYVNATPVQANVIPLALAGRDICASAQTGSGKTAAFVLPFLERLLYRPRDNAAIRVLVVTPTRELAMQIHEVLQKLSQYTDITSVLICGGNKNVKSQAAVLRNRPDVVICTPGRIIDHLRNSPSVTIDELDVLVLDEVDRLMDLGFEAELDELVRFCPQKRQTMLFSATMTTKVEDLAKLSLRKPVRVKTTPGTNHAVAARLTQEFVRLRKPEEREAHLMALVCRSFKERVIIFFETKRDAHRFYLLLGLFGVRACELHGDLGQTQRYQSLKQFREEKVDVMIATDVAARGLDIPGVRCVLNGDMPRSASTYVHRVGRTARAGLQGRAVTLVSDARRKIMKEVLKAGTLTSEDGAETIATDAKTVLTRVVPSAVVMHYLNKIAGLEDALNTEYKQERQNRKLDDVEKEMERVTNLVEFQEEIYSRPKRTWHQSEREKTEVKDASLAQAKLEIKQAAGEVKRRGAWPQPNQEELFDDKVARDKKTKDKTFGLSRKQKRRLAAMEEIAEADEEIAEAEARAKDRAEALNAGKTVKSTTEKLWESSKRNVKKEKEEREEAMLFLQKDRNVAKKKAKGAETLFAKKSGPKFAVGGLDQDMSDWGLQHKNASKFTKKAQKEEEWKEYDPNATEKGKKQANKSFKSKSRYKRR